MKYLKTYERKLLSTKNKHGFRIKEFDIFSKNQNDSYAEDNEIYNIKLQKTPEMNTMKDWAKWMVDQIPTEQKLKFIENIKEKKFIPPKEATPSELKKRWEKKRNAISALKNNIKKLKRRIDSDLNSNDEKTQIVATIAKIILMTGERVGNETSKLEGRHGITNLKKKHISVNGDTITLKYTGKSNVSHDRTIKNTKVSSILKKLLKRKSSEIFVTENGLSIKAPQVNTYLSQFDITSKDLRGFRCNKLMQQKLRAKGKIKEEKDRKKIFNELLRNVAEQIGHTPQILRSAYLLPEIEENFYNHGSIGRVQKLSESKENGISETEYYIISYESDYSSSEDTLIEILSKIKSLGLSTDDMVKNITRPKIKYYRYVIICKKEGENYEDLVKTIGSVYFSLITDYEHLIRKDVYDILGTEDFLQGYYDDEIKELFTTNKLGLM